MKSEVNWIVDDVRQYADLGFRELDILVKQINTESIEGLQRLHLSTDRLDLSTKVKAHKLFPRMTEITLCKDQSKQLACKVKD